MLEEQLQAQGREVLRLLLQDHQDLRGSGHGGGSQVTAPDGMPGVGPAGHSRPLSSVFAQVTVSWVAYQCRARRTCFRRSPTLARRGPTSQAQAG